MSDQKSRADDAQGEGERFFPRFNPDPFSQRMNDLLRKAASRNDHLAHDICARLGKRKGNADG